MSRATQPFLSLQFKPRFEHGGSIRLGKRKLARPIDPKRPIHLVLRSKVASGRLSMLHPENSREIHMLVLRWARRYGVQIYRFANSGNHLHLLLKARTRKGFQDFLRVISGIIAQLVTGAKKGRKYGKFWSSLAYTRVVEWGRAFIETKYYVIRNELEALGMQECLPARRAAKRNNATAPPMRP